MPDLHNDVVFQLRIWGYASTGDAIEPGALTAEYRPATDGHIADLNRLFDHDSGHLFGRWLVGDDGWPKEVPDHWALPWVTEHRMRQEMSDA